MKIHASHILVEHAFEAEDLLRKLSEGSDFGELARKFSKCPSGKQGGDLGVIESQRLDQDFVEGYEALCAGQISGTIRTRFGYHLIRRERE